MLLRTGGGSALALSHLQTPVRGDSRGVPPWRVPGRMIKVSLLGLPDLSLGFTWLVSWVRLTCLLGLPGLSLRFTQLVSWVCPACLLGLPGLSLRFTWLVSWVCPACLLGSPGLLSHTCEARLIKQWQSICQSSITHVNLVPRPGNEVNMH